MIYYLSDSWHLQIILILFPSPSPPRSHGISFETLSLEISAPSQFACRSIPAMSTVSEKIFWGWYLISFIVRACINIISDAVVEYKKVVTPTFTFRFNKFPKFDLLVLNMPGTRNVPLGDFQIENNIVPCNCSLIKVRLSKHSSYNL